MAYVSVEVDVDLDEFSTQELIDELENRDVDYELEGDFKPLIREMYERQQQGKPIDEQLSKLYWYGIGRIV